MARILRFTGGGQSARDKLNEVVDAVNILMSLRGGTFINVKQTPFATSVELNLEALLPKIPKLRDQGIGWAKVVDGRELTPAQNAYVGSVGSFSGAYIAPVAEVHPFTELKDAEAGTPYFKPDFYPFPFGSIVPYVINPSGGFYILQPTVNAFLVTLTKDGGARGSSSTTCSWTYTIKSVADTITLATAKEPLRPRWANTEYFYGGEVSRTSLGWAYCSGTNIYLLEALGEVQDTGAC